MVDMIEKLGSMSNYELGEVAKAFTECGKHKDCVGCPCEGVLCGVYDIVGSRDYFVREVAKRLMNAN